MPFEMAPPKYARVVAALQERITNGTYPPGSMLPSEEQLLKEFGVSRTTVIRALQILNQQGWIDSHQGKGRFVRGRPASAAERPRPGREALEEDESADSRLVHVGHVIAPDAVAAALNLKKGEAVLMRRRLVVRDGEPSELVTAYFPLDIAYGTELGSDKPLPEGVRRHVETRRKVRYDHMTERIVARPPSAEEAELLAITSKRTPVLALTVTAYDATGRPLQVAQLVLPGDRHELEDTYPLI
ncbi:GntR family transcriptional regulator [Carbonactinospora thermoautotrophica]|uniref:GntR family transcriptional regulator n=1 Tax=Carbonactinospora thermoautotrophica TaxID=1469144 RepID=UPI0022704E7E|nr:GntR family transcriptional regulator [Carbonactinospora thermoautotrophica]MCX9193536.1 GntR family transcriptional regulator [Carbonactinospora thermoautotrophica]